MYLNVWMDDHGLGSSCDDVWMNAWNGDGVVCLMGPVCLPLSLLLIRIVHFYLSADLYSP